MVCGFWFWAMGLGYGFGFSPRPRAPPAPWGEGIRTTISHHAFHFGRIAQLVRALSLYLSGSRFESWYAH